MQLPNQQMILTGANLLDDIEKGLLVGEVRVVPRNFTFGVAALREATLLCRCPCTPAVWSIKINVKPGCDPCDLCVGFKAEVDRDGVFSNNDYLDSSRTFMWRYPFNGFNTDATSETIAAYFVKTINFSSGRGGASPFTAELDPSDATNSTILITGKDCGFFRLYNLENCSMQELTCVSSGFEGSLHPDDIARMFPLNIGFIPGQGLGGSGGHENGNILVCKNPCKITLYHCVDACESYGGISDVGDGLPSQGKPFLPEGAPTLPLPPDVQATAIRGKVTRKGDRQNQVHLHAAATPFNVEIWLDMDHPDYAAFITKLEGCIGKTLKNISPCAAGQEEFVAPVAPVLP